MKKLITILIASLLLLTAIYSQHEPRPANEWWIYFIAEDGERRSMLIERTYIHEAIQDFYKSTNYDPEIRVTCVTNPHWNYCIEREW